MGDNYRKYVTNPTEIDISRFELAVRKFLAFERACGRSRHLVRYCELMRHALAKGSIVADEVADKPLLIRLAQVGLLKPVRRVLQSPSPSPLQTNTTPHLQTASLKSSAPFIRAIATAYEPLQIPQAPGEQSETGRWLFGELGSHEILRFYAMRSAGIGWILRDLEQQVHQGRQVEPRGVQIRVAANTALLEQIWRICLHYELTEVEHGDLSDADIDVDPIDEVRPVEHSAVLKEKLGLAQLPNIHQLRHIKATCHYHRKSAGW